MAIVNDILTYADQRLVNGQAVVSWPAFQKNGTPVAGGQLTVLIEDGIFNVELYSNIDARPAGMYYTTTYELDEGKVYTEYWIIPNLPTVKIGQIRIDFPIAPSASISALQLTSAGATYGQFLGWNGSHWVPMYVSTANLDVQQTPWVSDIDAAGYSLVNASTVGIGNAGLSPIPIAGYVHLIAGPQSPSPGFGIVTACGNTTATGQAVGSFSFANFALGSGEKRIAEIRGDLDGAPNSGRVSINTWNAGVVGARMSITAAGNVGIATTSPLYRLDLVGDVNITGLYRVNGVPLSTGASGQAQTPWLSNIDGSGYNLNNAGTITAKPAVHLRGVSIASSNADLAFESPAGLMRWNIGKTNEPEAGGNTGSRLAIGRYADDGSWISTTMVINRDGTGHTTFYGPIGIAVDNPAYALDIAGDCNLTGTYRVNGVPLSAGGGSGAVSSVFSRTGAVVAQAGDYTAAQVGAVPITRQIVNGAGMSGGGPLSADLTLAVVADSVVERVRISSIGALIGTRREINFVSGVNVTCAVTDNAASNRVDVSIAATGGAQTPWNSDIDAAGHALTNAGNISLSDHLEIKAKSGEPADIALTSPAGVLRWSFGKGIDAETGGNAGSYFKLARYADDGSFLSAILHIHRDGAGGATFNSPVGLGGKDSPAYPLDVTGDVNISGFYRINGVPIGSVGGAAQTPWTSDIDAANHKLSNLSTLWFKQDSSNVAFSTFLSPAALSRWTHGTTVVETGANAGSDYAFWRFDDSGNWIGYVMRMVRATGNIGVGEWSAALPAFPLDVKGDVNCTGNYLVNGTPIGGGAGGRPSVSAYMTGTSPVFLAGIATAVPFNAAEFDTAGGSMHSNTVNNTRLVAPTAGYYLLIGSHQFNSAATGTVAKFVINGTTDVTGSQTQAVITSFVTAAVTACVYLSVGDYAEYVITAVSADAPLFTYTDAPRAAPRFQLICVLPLSGGPAVSAYMTGTSPVFLAGVSTPVPFNATEFDTSGSGSMHSNTVNNTRLVAPTAGYYLLIGNHQFNSAATGTVAKFVINGTTDVTGSQTQAVITSFVTAAVTATVHLNANDYVEYFITAVSADAPVFTYTDAPRGAPRLQLIRLF